jgi:hypothetical protein
LAPTFLAAYIIITETELPDIFSTKQQTNQARAEEANLEVQLQTMLSPMKWKLRRMKKHTSII